MDARPLLVEVARALRLARLEAVLIGNAAAALRGAPVTTIDSYEGLRDRAGLITIDGESLLVAALADIIKSKRAAGRPRDLAVIAILERAHEATTSKPEKSPRRARKRK